MRYLKKPILSLTVALISVLLMSTITTNIADFIVLGYVNDDQVQMYMDIPDTCFHRLDQFISITNSNDVISPTPVSFLSIGKYYIIGVGVVPRWSPLHKKIKNIK